MMIEHTAGPWSDGGWSGTMGTHVVRGDDGSTVAQCGGPPGNPTVGANARLIAAAPDLLEALTQFRAFIRDGWGGAVRLQSSSLVADIYANDLFRKVDAAIAKAVSEHTPEHV